jgi:Sulfotransferase domain
VLNDAAPRALFEDYIRRPKRYWPPRPGEDLQARKVGRFAQAAANTWGDDLEAAIERVVSLALKRAPDRPPPIYVMGLGGSGSHWLGEMLGELTDAVYALEAYLPPPFLEQMQAMSPNEQGLLVDCLHLAHALLLSRNADMTEEAVIAARVVNPAGGVIRPRLKTWDPHCSVIHMIRDPLDQVSSVTYRKMGYRQYEAPDADDDEYLKTRADGARQNLYAWRESPIQADLVCHYEELRKSPVPTLERLLAALGEQVGSAKIASVVRDYDASLMRQGLVKPRGNIHLAERREPSVHQRALLHSILAEARAVAGYPADECLGEALALKAPRGERTLRFPRDGGLGTIFVRETNGENPGWRQLAEAKGEVRIPNTSALKLRVRESATPEAMESLQTLPPDGLGSLCLAGNTRVDDRLVGTLAKTLVGIEELDLSRTSITHNCRDQLTPLRGLKGLNLLETAIASHNHRASLSLPTACRVIGWSR